MTPLLDSRSETTSVGLFGIVFGFPNRPNGKGQFEKSLAKRVRPFACSPVRRKKKGQNLGSGF